MRLDAIDLLVASGRSTASSIEDVLCATFKELETSGATSHLTTIDVCNTNLAIAAVGVLSLYESRLKAKFGWSDPFKELTALLEGHWRFGSDEINELVLAINALKHGTGRSHNKLLERMPGLTFVLMSNYDDYEEGDVCPPQDLVVVTVDFLRNLCDVVEKTWIAANEVKSASLRL